MAISNPFTKQKVASQSMFYYRYRPFTEVSLKELLYNEMYFSSPEECNDPFDSKTFYVLNKDEDKWRKLIQFALKEKPLEAALLDVITQHILKKCPMTFDEAINGKILTDIETSFPEEKTFYATVENQLKRVLNLYRPPTQYFVSFSKTNSESLMWSHYADKHKGFCLIFKPINGKIKQSHRQQKHQIHRKTPNSFAEEMSYEMPKEFELIDISYEAKVKHLNGFLHLPVAVVGEVKNKKDRLNINSQQNAYYSQKGKSWIYEKESRLILSPPMSWLFGEQIDYTNHERLFHYEPSQLVGIIYGARMTLSEKNRVREIMKEKMDWQAMDNYKKIVFNFMEFEAKLSTNQRNVDINPTAMLTHKTLRPGDADFERLYKEWQEGWGHQRDENGSKRIKVA